MENFDLIEFHKARDFSRKMNATFEFIRQNFKSLFKSILFIAGPPVLIASMLIGSFMGEFMNISMAMNNTANMTNRFLSVSFWMEILLMCVLLLISGIVTVATVNNYIIIYGEKKTNKIEVNEVWDRVRATFWMYFGSMFFFMILFFGAYILMAIPVVLLATISPALLFLLVPVLICAFMYVIFGSSLAFFIRNYEGIGFFSSVRRSLYLVRGKWWSTFGLIMILYMIVSTISYIFIIPAYVLTFMKALHNINPETFQEPSASTALVTTVLFTVYYLVYMILSSLPNVGIAFQYFNLVEMKEAKGLMSQIETLGEVPPPPSTTDEHY
jgi:hypothetical protein